MEETISIRQQLRQFLLPIAQQKGIASFGDDESLSSSGIIDSLAIFRLVAFLEDTFSIRIADDEILSENFESIQGMEQFVIAKLDRKSANR